MADWNPRANDLFLKALDVAEPDRPAFLAGECGGDADLRKAVDTLLNAHAQAGGFLADPHPDALPTGTFGDRAVTHTADDGDATASHTPPVGTPGILIAGRYKLLQQIGEGGMGTVWMADQTEPVKRRVAVKLIRAERGSSATILARFEAERQAIALMDHPHIAKLLDAGTTAEGAPFFVMELVKGVPLTEYCDAHRLSVPDRLALFQSICGAVQHAHQKGIIHRDLKPSNILVESHDGKPVPKVIDFGLAKATTGMRLTENTLFTGFGTVMGTPTYMAPEQATFNAVDVDTRADVYALGVILYELLTGTTPLTRDTVRNALLDEMLRLIREQEAPSPSSRLSSSASKPSIAANRQMEPAKLGRFVRGELDWIVLKALSKDRDRRYETANGFAADVGRFLAHEPVTAGPPSVRYRLRKFVRRNRPQVIAAGLVLGALVAGVVGTMTGLVEARQQRDRAIDAEAETAAQLVKTQEAEGVARTEAAKATKAAALADARAQAEREMRARAERQTELAAETTRFMTEVLTLGRPEELGRVAGTPTALPTVKQALDVAAEKIGTRFRGQPEIEMMVRVTVGKTYRELGEYAAARPHLERCLELAERQSPASPMILTMCRRELAMACAKLNDYGRAVPLFELAVAGAEQESGPFAKQALSVRNDLAQMFNEAGDYDLAEPLFRRILADAPRSPDDVGAVVNSASNNLGLLYVSRKKFDLAEPLLLAALKWAREHPGQGPHPAAYANNLANAYYGQNKFDLAEPLLKEAYERYHVTHGDAHPTTLTMINNLAGLYLGQKKYHLAEPLMESAVAVCRKSLGPTNMTTLALVANLGTLYGNQDKNDRAEPLLVEALTGLRKHAPANHPITLNAAHSLGELYRARKDYARAEPLLIEAADGREKKLTAAHPSTITSVLRLIVLYEAQNKHDRAEPWWRKRAAVAKGVHGADSAEYAIELSSLGRNLMKQKKYADAEPLLLKGYEGLKAREKTISPQGNTRIPESLDWLIELYTATKKPDEVKTYRDLRANYPPERAPLPRGVK